MNTYNDFDLSKILWYKIGPIAKVLIEVNSREDVLEAFYYLKNNKISKFVVIGLGSNLLFGGDYHDGAVLKIGGSGDSLKKINKDTISCFAGEDLDDVIKFSFKNNLIGLEWAGGLPGTIGAAVRGNVGAFGGEIKNHVSRVEVIELRDNDYEIKNYSNSDLGFAYRTSLVKQNKNLIITSVELKLTLTDEKGVEKAKETYNKNIDYRNSRHPLDLPSCGSVFKNITNQDQINKVLNIYPDIKEKMEKSWHGKIAAGFLIGKLGFSGYQIGGAKISEKHNNFIVNFGNAKFSDIKGLIDKISEKFNEVFGFAPETEVEIIS